MNIVIIPARFGSSRFPGKPLALIQGEPMIWHVYQRCLRARTIDEVWVATDDQRIYDAVDRRGGRAMMTRSDHSSGTDRVAEAAAAVPGDIIVNVQGDEPLIDPVILDAVVKPLVENPEIVTVTPIARIKSREALFDTSVAKIVRDKDGFALYFSRSSIPFIRDSRLFKDKGLSEETMRKILEAHFLYRHVGVYGFRRKTLFRFCSLPPSSLEKLEKLEQLRALENGIPVYTVVVDYKGVGVDTPGDLEKLKEMGLG